MAKTFQELLQIGSRVYRAPGRVNLIGEHTDYNDGYVMPVAIDLFTQVAINPHSDDNLIIYSETFSDCAEFDLDEPNPQPRGHWSDYVRGVALTITGAGYRVKGAEMAIQSNVPVGAGLSSSAALETVSALALLEAAGVTIADPSSSSASSLDAGVKPNVSRPQRGSQTEIDRIELAKLCQQAENEFVGMRCGIMDQFVASCGRAGKALMLDCRSLEYTLLPLPEDVRLVICNTMVKHELCSSEYNTRRGECEAGVRYFANLLPGIKALRDVSIGDLERFGSGLSEVVYKRCRHVISENARVLEAATALERNDLNSFGALMAASHHSLRNDYEVSCEELDIMVELTTQLDGVYGARMTGGGFGGSTINLVKAENVAEFKRIVAEGYERITGFRPDILVCTAADGAQSCE
jgi:galactokinase